MTREQLKAGLARIRKDGFAVDDQENESDVHCVGAIIFEYVGKPIGALSVSEAASQLSCEKARKLGLKLRKATQHISSRMRYTESATTPN